MTDEIDLTPHYEIWDLKRAIGELNEDYMRMERERISVLTHLKDVNKRMRINRSKVERLVEFIREEQARGEKVGDETNNEEIEESFNDI